MNMNEWHGCSDAEGAAVMLGWAVGFQLLADWELAINGQTLFPIDPLR